MKKKQIVYCSKKANLQTEGDVYTLTYNMYDDVVYHVVSRIDHENDNNSIASNDDDDDDDEVSPFSFIFDKNLSTCVCTYIYVCKFLSIKCSLSFLLLS